LLKFIRREKEKRLGKRDRATAVSTPEELENHLFRINYGNTMVKKVFTQKTNKVSEFVCDPVFQHPKLN